MNKRVLAVTLTAVALGAMLFWPVLRFVPRGGSRQHAEAPAALDAKLNVQSAGAPTTAPASRAVKRSAIGNFRLAKQHKPSPPKPADEPPFARFAVWVEKYLSADAATRAALEVEGIELAQARRAAMSQMIRTNPQRALELTVGYGVRRALPKSVRELLEEPVSGRGTLWMQAALAMPGKESEVRPNNWIAQLGQREFDTYVYGRRLGEPTRFNIPLHGVAVDNFFAASEDPVRVLEPEEAEAVEAEIDGDRICGVSGQPTTVNNEETIVDVGGEKIFLCGANHEQLLNDRLAADEGDTPLGDPQADDGPQASAWTEGVKNIIFIRVDFSDKPGVPFSDATGATMVSNVDNFYTDSSYGRTSVAPLGQGSDLTPTFRMPQPAAYYGTNYLPGQLRTDAKAAASAAGYNLSSYNRDVIMFDSVPGFSWSGLANVGAAGAWINNTTSAGTVSHELGHNWGLNHANYWDTGGTSVIGANGTSVEYGDSYDTMGSASAGVYHFNARNKAYLNWVQSSEWLTVSTNGTYRIFAHDYTNATGLRLLKILRSGSTTNYFVEFRQKFTSNKYLMNGAGLRWAAGGNYRSMLLDTTPGSANGKTDSAIVIGRTYSEKALGIHITPIGKGGTTPESLDVVVNLGSFPSNVPPTLTLTAPVTNASTGVTLSFTASASDANGDTLAYYWDFGDGNFGTNGPTASKSWSSTGEYVVRCVVTDMKGGLASKSVVVKIGSPTTYRISGQVTSGVGGVVNARVFVSTALMTWTDSDGSYNLVGLPAGTYTVGAELEGYGFASSGTTNVATVGPNKTGVNFVDTNSPYMPPTITSQPASQTAYVGQDVTFNVAVSGTPPFAYQWRRYGTNLAGATTNSYTRASVQLSDSGSYTVAITNATGSVTSSVATLAVLPVGSSTFTWDGEAADGLWQPGVSPANWVGDSYSVTNTNRANYIFVAPAYGGTNTITLKSLSPDIGNLTLNANASDLTFNVDGSGSGRLDLSPPFSGVETLSIASGSNTINSLNSGKVRLMSADDQDWNIAADSSLTVNAIIESEGTTNGFTKLGDGTLTLNATNTYSGKTHILGGTVNIVTPASLGGLPATGTADQVTLDGGHLHVLSAPISSGANRGFTLGAGSGEIEVDSGVTCTIQGLLTGPGGFTKTGQGTLDFTASTSSNYTFNGKVAVLGGTLRINSANKLGNAPPSVVADQITLDSATLSFNSGSGVTSPNQGVVIGDNSATFNIESSTLALNGPVSGNGGLIKLGAGQLQLNGSNSFAGDTTVLSGTLAVDGDGTFGDGTGTLTLNGGTLASTANRNAFSGILPNPLVMTTSTVIQDAVDAAAGTQTFPLGFNSIVFTNGTLTLRTLVTNAAVHTFSPRFSGAGFEFTQPIVFDKSMASNPANASIQLELFSSNSAPAQILSGPISGPGRVRRGALVSGEAGTTVLAGANTYTVGTSLDRGCLGFGTNSVSSGGNVISGPIGTGTLTIGNDPQIGLFAWAGPRVVENYIILNQTANTLIYGGNALTLAGPISLGATTTKTITISNTALTTFSGVVSNSAPLIKAGAGTLALTGNNTYSGGTTISEGALLVNNTLGSGTGSGNVIVNAPGKLSGSGTVSGLVSGNGTVAPGNSAGTMTLGGGLNLSSGGAYLWELATNSTSGAGINFDQLAITNGNLVLGASSKLQIAFTDSATSPDVSNGFWLTSHSWRIVSLSGGATNPGNSNFGSLLNATNSTGYFYTTADSSGIVLNYVSTTPPPPPVLSATIAGAGTANALLTWSGTAGVTYEVQYNNDLTTTNWIVLGTVAATNNVVSFADTNGPAAQRFYRLLAH